MAFDSLVEYDQDGTQGSYNLSFDGDSTVLNFEVADGASPCDESASCTFFYSSANLPSGGYAIPYDSNSASGAQRFSRFSAYVEHGEVRSLDNGWISTFHYMPSTFQGGDFFFFLAFEGWSLNHPDSTLNMTLRFDTFIDGVEQNTASWTNYDTTAYSTLQLGDGINIVFANRCTNLDGSTEPVGLSYIVTPEYVEVEISFVPSTTFEYTYGIQFDTKTYQTCACVVY